MKDSNENQKIAEPLPRSLLYLLAVSTGSAVACIYLNQPLLHILGQSFHVSNNKIGLISSLTQVGYALGLFFLIPLGDVISKKKIILVKQIALLIVLGLSSVAPTWTGLLGLSFFLGIFATVAQDFIPLAADLATDANRGKTIGTVMSGLFTGILFSRTLAGVISDLSGWRTVFGVFCGLTIILAMVVAFKIPGNIPKDKISYFNLVKSLFFHLKDKSQLRYSLLTHGLVGVAFSGFWTSLSFYLSEAPFHLSTSEIGLFGIAGAAGVLAAPVAGRMADKYSPYRGVIIGISIVVLSFIGMLSRPHSLWMLIVGAVVFDLGLQMALISHQSIIYALDPAARSRLNGLFFSSLFCFTAMGSVISVRVEALYGWTAVLIVCLVSALLALIVGVTAWSKFKFGALHSV